MGSHMLTKLYIPIPEALRARLTGDDYELPDFGAADPNSLKGYRVALVTTHGPELPEFHVPLQYLRDRGALVEVLTQDYIFDWIPGAEGLVVLAEWLATDVCAKADKKISEAKIEDYDAVITIGGAWNPIMLRTDKSLLTFISNAHKNGRLIASICHGPQVLINLAAFPDLAAFPRGTLATGVDDIRFDMANAGFTVLDKAVVYDESQRLVTSPSPKYLKEFCEEIGWQIKKVIPIVTV